MVSAVTSNNRFFGFLNWPAANRWWAIFIDDFTISELNRKCESFSCIFAAPWFTLAAKADFLLIPPQPSDVSVQSSCSLADLPLQQFAVITAINAVNDAVDEPSLLRRMAEIGFLPGEKVKLVARIPGGDPLAVRVGRSTFALRRREALCIQVRMC